MPLKDGRKKKRDMDHFLEQLKRDQAQREDRLKSRAEQGNTFPRGSWPTRPGLTQLQLFLFRWFFRHRTSL